MHPAAAQSAAPSAPRASPSHRFNWNRRRPCIGAPEDNISPLFLFAPFLGLVPKLPLPSSEPKGSREENSHISDSATRTPHGNGVLSNAASRCRPTTSRPLLPRCHDANFDFECPVCLRQQPRRSEVSRMFLGSLDRSRGKNHISQMKHIFKIVAMLVAISAIWIALLETSTIPRSYTWMLPIYLVVALGCYGLFMVGFGLMFFPTCPQEAVLLQQDITEAKEFLAKNGVDVGSQ
ncbi:hypothetical protein EJB05_04258, partial [Eragrostis curvula]